MIKPINPIIDILKHLNEDTDVLKYLVETNQQLFRDLQFSISAMLQYLEREKEVEPDYICPLCGCEEVCNYCGTTWILEGDEVFCRKCGYNYTKEKEMA